jgi:hypothetical protein
MKKYYFLLFCSALFCQLSSQSVLQEGTLYKIAIPENGIYRIDADFLSGLGIDLNTLDPRSIKMYGTGGKMLPAAPGALRPERLPEIAISISGEEDGRFDPNDYLLFYGQGPGHLEYDEETRRYTFTQHLYDTRSYYFLKISPGNGRRIGKADTPSGTSYTSSTYDLFYRLEEDHNNLLYEWEKAQGTGYQWYGDHFKVTRQYSYPLDLTEMVEGSSVEIEAKMALRARTDARFYLDIEGQTLSSDLVNEVELDDGESTFARIASIQGPLSLPSREVEAAVRFPFPENSGDRSEAWLDYLEIQTRASLAWKRKSLEFSDGQSMDYPTTSFQISNPENSNLSVWNVSSADSPASHEINDNSFSAYTGGGLQRFIIFNANQPLPAPEAVGQINNQNILNTSSVDMLIIFHPDFSEQAMALADHRATYSGLQSRAVSVTEIYNEFASGSKDPTAIRDYAAYVYGHSSELKYLLLFGDASFDARDIYQLGGDYIPTFYKDGLNPIYAYPTDDFFGILEGPAEGAPLNGNMQLAVGRLPVNNPEEASAIVDKIIRYETAPQSKADWRNRLVFVGDDRDHVTQDADHYQQADEIAGNIQDSFPIFNQEKIYLPAHTQEATSGGERSPSANAKINQQMYRGALAVVYLGHGGPKGWAQERILNISDINSWDNEYQLPIFVTATCTFTGYDDPAFTTAGEEVFLNQKGGAVALLTTTRAVFTGGNKALTRRSLIRMLSNPPLSGPRTIGQAFRDAKNTFNNSDNARKFTLIGDPAMAIALPKYAIRTTSINGVPVSDGQQDTLRALQKVIIKGAIVDEQGAILNDFNGLAYPTVFDKAQTARTLEQGVNTAYSYEVQSNTLFKGRASVKNGLFEFTFVVPKDINYEYGPGKLSYYAYSQSIDADAAGFYDQFLIGGTSENAISDTEGPEVQVFMNTENFVFGGVTNNTPTLLVKLKDDNGINVVGNSIGHDLEGILNDDTQNTLLLNDFYEAALDDHTSGTARFPMTELDEGRHRVRVKAWDIANNTSEGYTEFVVASSEKIALRHVLNYPNPFTDQTCFQFDHNLTGQEMEVKIDIYTVSGRLVKTLHANLLSDGAIRQDDCIRWDGRDTYGQRLARGVYLYKVSIQAQNTGNSILSGNSAFEKLVLLK